MIILLSILWVVGWCWSLWHMKYDYKKRYLEQVAFNWYAGPVLLITWPLYGALYLLQKIFP